MTYSVWGAMPLPDCSMVHHSSWIGSWSCQLPKHGKAKSQWEQQSSLQKRWPEHRGGFVSSLGKLGLSCIYGAIKEVLKLINSKLFLYIYVPLTAKVKSIRTNPRNHKLQEWPQHSWSKYGTSNQVTKSSPDQMLDKQAQTFL